MRRKEGKDMEGNNNIKRRHKEYNKFRSKKLTAKYLDIISFKISVRKQYRVACKGNVVAYLPFRDNG